MWTIFGNRTKARQIKGGREETRHCPGCGTTSRYIECDVTDKVHVFFIDLVELTQRRMVCSSCGEDAEIDDSAQRTTTPAIAAHPPAAPPRKPPSETEKDRMLAELKAKMRREGKLRD
jgi:hypothetical protein